MSTIVEAITWSGSGATLSLFAVFRDGPPSGDPVSVGLPEYRLERYLLEDEDRVLDGATVMEYDFHFDSPPVNLWRCVETLLKWARSGGAVVAWFGFEGSFHFEHLLTEDIANQIYALADAEGITLAEDRDLHSTSWKERVVRAGGRAIAT